MSSSAVFRRFSLVCAAVLVTAAAAVPAQTEDGAAAGLGTVLWSVLDACFDPDSTEPAAVCLKLKALTAMDRALAKPNVVIAEGVSLAARAGKSLPAHEPSAEQADRAALDAARDPDHKNALLDDMLAGRVDRLMSTRTIVLDGQEGEVYLRSRRVGYLFSRFPIKRKQKHIFSLPPSVCRPSELLYD